MPNTADRPDLAFLRVPLLLLAGMIGALALGWVGSEKSVPWRHEESPGAAAAGATTCYGTTHVTVAVAPAIYEPVTAALDGAGDECVVVEATPVAPADVAASAADGAPLPDVWIADATYWYSRAFLHSPDSLTVLAGDVAHTPVLLVGGDRATRYPTWSAAEVSGWVSTPDPTTTTAATLAVAAPVAEAALSGAPAEKAQQELVPYAQDYGGRRARGLDDVVALDTVEPTSRRLQVATEQDLIAAFESRPFLRSLTPATGSPVVRYSVAVSDDGPGAVRRTARDIIKVLRSSTGQEALRDAGLRPTGKDPRPVGKVLPAPPAKVLAGMLDTWRVVSVPSSMLAVVDVSGSMDFAAGTSTRMDLLAQSATVGIGMLPGHARVGLWVFSVERGGPDQDWLVLNPTQRLDKLDHGRTQRYALQERIAELPSLTDGGTGLYDTALAAFRQAQSDYRPGYANSVVLLSDGANDDPGSLTLSQLIAQLEATRDPSRPTRIVAVGVSDDADMPALQAMATATGGEAFQAIEPADIAGVFARAVLARVNLS
jgi:hypothetical protein